MDVDSPRGPLSHSSVVSPAQASRIEQAIRRYEDEIQNICRSNAQLRASIQTKPSSFSQSLPAFNQSLPPRVEAQELRLRPVIDIRTRAVEQQTTGDSGIARKMQLRIESLEDYVQSLEEKLRDAASARPHDASLSSEVLALRSSLNLLREENSTLKEQVDSLTQSCRAAEQRIRFVSSDQSAWQSLKADLEDTIDRLRSELKRRNEEKAQSDAEHRSLEGRYQQIQGEYATVCRTRSSDTTIMQEKIAALEGEVNHYKTLAGQRDEENTRMVQKLRDYVKESEETQEDLRYRIQMLEARQAVSHRSAKTEPSDLDDKPKRERPRKRMDSEGSPRNVDSHRRMDDSLKSPSDSVRKSREASKKSQSDSLSKLSAPRPKSAKSNGEPKSQGGHKKSSKERHQRSP